jgi:glycosyltransferase involved in cell wall biosynthesis
VGLIPLVSDKKPPQAGPLFFWCHETWHQPVETGVQRVVRRFGNGLAECRIEVVPVGWDWRTRRIKALGSRAAGSERALSSLISSEKGAAPWLIIPEISLGLAMSDLDPVQIGRAYGLKTAALLHDLIPLKLSGDYGDDFLALFRRYVAMFAAADIIFTTTNYVANDLRMRLGHVGSLIPDIATVPLPAQFADQKRCSSTKPPRAPGAPLRLLTVSTWEPRKNLPRLLRAIRQAQTQSASIELAVIGQRGHFPDYDAEVEAIIADMPNVTICGSISDKDLLALYAHSHASVYPSVEEGFGLPIGESLWLATPCLCHNGSSMAEIAPGGGVLTVDMTDEAAITRVLVDLATKRDLLSDLTAETVARPLATWNDYAREVASKLQV